MTRRLPGAILFLLIAVLARPETIRAEICGDGIDNAPTNGLTDEGCQPHAVGGVIESPLPTQATGVVAPKSGQLVWNEPADIDPQVAFGPSIAFRRTYLSLYEPGYLAPSATNYRAPMGYGWHHGFMGWVDRNNTPNPDQAVVHLVTGQDVLFTYSSNDGTYDYFTPQAGYHFVHLRQKTSTSDWELKTLEGWTYAYDEQVTGTPTSKLTAIKDSLGNAVAIHYSAATGQIDQVTDASGDKYLAFDYGTSGAKTLIGVRYFSAGGLQATLVLPNSYQLTTAQFTNRFRQYSYSASNKLLTIKDMEGATGNTIAEFKYLSATTGKVARVHSGQGYLGYAYGDTTCNSGSGTYLYYNFRDDTKATCDTNADCGSGEFCGGQETPGSPTETGVCFRARRCAAWVTGNEDMIGAVSSSCPTCTDTADRVWDATNVELDGKKSADNVWTSYGYNSNGLVDKIVENDTDADASSVPPSGARVTYFKYDDTSYPGLVTEVRRLSELKSGGTCGALNPTDCKRTIYTYITGQLNRQREIGFTYDATGAVVAYDFSTFSDHDPHGRVYQIRGPRTDTADDVIDITYHSDTDSNRLRAGHLNQIKRKVGSSSFLITTYDVYNGWGNATKVTDPNSNLTCLTFDDERNVLTTRRVAMANQTSCTANVGDLVTTYTYDSALRVTREKRPEGNCFHRIYDLFGRLSKVKERDDCTPGSFGHVQEFTYDDDGLRVKVEYKDVESAGTTLTYRRESTFGADRRLSEILNPESPTKKKTFAYEADGMLDTISGEDGVGKTEWVYDNFNRTDAELRHNDGTGTNSDTWNLLPGIQLDLPRQVIDEDSKAIDWVWDDMGRKVKQVTPDNGTSIMVYDPAGNLVTHVESKTLADQKTHTFTYDPQNRITGEDYGDANCTLGGAEIEYQYDSTTGCPTGACENVAGRLAFVKTKVKCYDDGLGGDDTFDQLTYFKYDDAGRTVKETIQDDGGREAIQNYTWDRNSNPVAIFAQSGVYAKYGYDSPNTTNNSDRDRVIELFRNAGSDTTLVSNGRWLPFGPIKEYEQANAISGNALIARFTWDLAHRPTEILWEQKTTGTDLFKIAYTLDAQGRITVKDFTGGHTALDDSYYKYDWQNRITCDASVSDSICPSFGGTVKSNLNSTPPYTQSSDRKSLIHRTNQYPITTDTYTLAGGKDQISSIAHGGSAIAFGWDTRGNRLYDDDSAYTDDRRDYTYDARNNLVTVSGKLKISDTVVHNYTAVNAYDHKNRRFFKSILDTTSSVEEQWFYYYDLDDRLIEVKHTPNITDTSTYTLYQFYWIGQRPVAWFQTSYPTPTTTRRFFHADHLNTPVEAYSWPTSGDATRAWAITSDAFGWGAVAAGATVYQPLRFPGQMSDDETTALRWDATASVFKAARPPLSENRYRVYDALTASYLQADPEVAASWNAYSYVNSNPISQIDPDGRLVDKPGDDQCFECTTGTGGIAGGGSDVPIYEDPIDRWGDWSDPFWDDPWGSGGGWGYDPRSPCSRAYCILDCEIAKEEELEDCQGLVDAIRDYLHFRYYLFLSGLGVDCANAAFIKYANCVSLCNSCRSP